ncbi:MAG: FKBP-type peptidyl-prolyl cis-trans isomerase [Bifidobacteriaceae bacterium]|jgi:peptidylprolyl isomerase|nr:FKBP-type peptidyl-prolyl cis-trans isomerase [Bifidobacteriaceae bacterium]
MSHVWRAVPLIAALVLTASCSSGGSPAGESEAETPAQDVASADAEPGTDAGGIARATGEAVAPAAGLPVVTLAEDGTPSIEVPTGAEPPAELTVQTLIKGDGAEVGEGAEVSVQYAGWLWDGTEFDSSWSRGGVPLDARLASGELIEGWVQGLVGQTVRSQVMLIIPPELGYGEADMGTIPPNSTLIFVVDILSAS